MENESEKLKNIEFLVIKSRELLQEQLKSYESANNKAGVLISISALLIPIAVTFISSSDTVSEIKYMTILPIALMIVALTFLLKVLMPKGLDHGFNFEQFDQQIGNDYQKLLLFEIGANKSSYSDNMGTVIKQNRNFKTGVKLIFVSSILIFTLVTMSLFLKKNNSTVLKNGIVIENTDINNLNLINYE